jgi:hypothetical protein
MPARDLRPALLDKCNVIQAVLAFNYALTEENKSVIGKVRSDIRFANSKILKSIRDQVLPFYNSTLSTYGLIGDPFKFTAWFMAGSRNGTGIMYVSKAVIDAQYFSNFCNGHWRWQQFPPHFQLQVSYDWVVNSSDFRFHYYLPEATLYEDMAMAFNLATEGQNLPHRLLGTPGGTPEAKKHYMLMRTATLCAYYFVEAYLNGVAFDYHFRNKSSLSEEQSDLLLEWNSANSRQAFVSFERKIKEYPKLMLGTPHPPLTTTNSASMKTLLGDAKELRDAIVHQSPKIADHGAGSKKLTRLLGIRIDQVTPVVDAAVAFVRELNSALGPHGIDLNWLRDRDNATGVFPGSAFE